MHIDDSREMMRLFESIVQNDLVGEDVKNSSGSEKPVPEPKPVVDPETGDIVPGDALGEAKKGQTEYEMLKQKINDPKKMERLLNDAAAYKKLGVLDRVYRALERDYKEWKAEWNKYDNMNSDELWSGGHEMGKWLFPGSYLSKASNPTYESFYAKYIGRETIEITFGGNSKNYAQYIGTWLRVAYVYNYFLKPYGWLIRGPFEKWENRRGSSVCVEVITKTRAEMEQIADQFTDHMSEPWPEFPEKVKDQIRDRIDRAEKDPEQREFDPEELEESNPAPVNDKKDECTDAKPLPKKNPGV